MAADGIGRASDGKIVVSSQVRPGTEQILSATLGDYEATNITPSRVDGSELTSVKGVAGDRLTNVAVHCEASTGGVVNAEENWSG